MNLPLEKLIEKHILDEYKYLRNDISHLTTGDELYHFILTGAALGDRRTNSSFKRAKVSFDNGMDCVDELCNLGVIKLESTYGKHDMSDKILFSAPFLRFWFAFISPIFKGIKNGDYTEFFEKFKNSKAEFTGFIFEQLSHEFIKLYFQDDKIYNINRYWDDAREINIVAKTKSGKTIVGICKYTNSKIKKSELTKLEEDCKEAGIKADIIVIFSKNGYTNELKSLKDQNLRLFSIRNFKILLEN
ncbi:MAG: DUF234 domain-containing protein [Sulfurospirillaceae bacterium]|nr:DUF234 domain-containing protein [Sulfurospirillaceae bacterium]